MYKAHVYRLHNVLLKIFLKRGSDSAVIIAILAAFIGPNFAEPARDKLYHSNKCNASLFTE